MVFCSIGTLSFWCLPSATKDKNFRGGRARPNQSDSIERGALYLLDVADEDSLADIGRLEARKGLMFFTHF